MLHLSGILWQHYKDKANNNLADSESFKSKGNTTANTADNGNTKDVGIIVPLKYLSHFWKNLKTD